MRRFRRILLNAATVLSVLSFVGTVALWLRSYRHVDRLTLRPAPDEREIYANSGRLYYEKDMTWPDVPIDSTWGRDDHHEFLGFGTQARHVRRWSPDGMWSSGRYARWWFAPIWSASLACALLPAYRVLAWGVMRRPSRIGCCPTCGYDLRATPDRCPECGATPPAPTTTPVTQQPGTSAPQKR